MPGITGAVSHVSYDRGFLCDIVGGEEAKGICGSGLVDLVAVLLERGVIDESGRLLPPQDAPEDMRRYLTEDGQGNGVFHLTKAVSLTARDVRNLQLASGGGRRYSGAARAARRDGGRHCECGARGRVRQLSLARECSAHRHAAARVP